MIDSENRGAQNSCKSSRPHSIETKTYTIAISKMDRRHDEQWYPAFEKKKNVDSEKNAFHFTF